MILSFNHIHAIIIIKAVIVPWTNPRFIAIVSPRIRDFRGFSPKGFDGNGNYNFGINEQVIFPEINYDKINAIRGMNLTFVTSAKDDVQGLELLKKLSPTIH